MLVINWLPSHHVASCALALAHKVQNVRTSLLSLGKKQQRNTHSSQVLALASATVLQQNSDMRAYWGWVGSLQCP
jgi:hypothetical protein